MKDVRFPKISRGYVRHKMGLLDKGNFLLLTCIDLRYPKLIYDEMEPKFHKRYDHVCLAGAALAPVVDYPQDPKPHWQKTFLDHVRISRELHSIKRILVLDHRDCGAYRKFKLLEKSDNGTEKERLTHENTMNTLRKLLQGEADLKDLGFEGLLLPIEPELDEHGHAMLTYESMNA